LGVQSAGRRPGRFRIGRVGHGRTSPLQTRRLVRTAHKDRAAPTGEDDRAAYCR
jgi:hypothetical protein